MRITLRSSIALLVALGPCVLALDNGLALTPPMGWISWQRFRCNLDCENFPDDCISEKLYMRIADELVSGGYRDLGYVQVNIDDCWSVKTRDSNGRLVADPDRFPSGMKQLAKYMHDRGLKLGIYSDAGPLTCAGYPGSQNNEKVDAQTFADWDIDMLKYDGCNLANDADIGTGYVAMRDALKGTNKNILYSCEWPLYLRNTVPDYANISSSCNIFRNYNDVTDSFDSVKSIIDFYVKNQDLFAKYQRPGAFFDPDMLVIGNFGLSKDESELQMAAWTMWASPLFMSNDLAKMDDDSKKLLQNKAVIDLNQDTEGRMGKQIKQVGDVRIFLRPVLPKVGTSYSFGLALLHTSDGGGPNRIAMSAQDFGLTDPRGYELEDLFNNTPLGFVKPTDQLVLDVNPSGARLFKATVAP